MTDLRQAAQMALDALERALETSMRQALKARIPECGEFAGIAQDVDWAATALRTALEQQQAEPVAWMVVNDAGEDELWWHNGSGNGKPLYTTPPQRKPLTDEQVHAIWDHKYRGWFSRSQIEDITRAIEAAHCIKEGT